MNKFEYPGNEIHSRFKRKDVEISVMVYYTSQFAEGEILKQEGHTADSYVRFLIQNTNDIFKRSGITGVKLVLHGNPQPIDDVLGNNEVFPDAEYDDKNERINAFSVAKGGNVRFLLNSADIAMLVTKSGSNGGGTTGYAHSGCSYKKKSDYSSAAVKHSKEYFEKDIYGCSEGGYKVLREPIGWAQGQLALTFTHEVGHILGALHNPEEEGTMKNLLAGRAPWNPDTKVAEGANYGYWMKQKYVGQVQLKGETGEFDHYEGKRTIMAYDRGVNRKSKEVYSLEAIAYFSSPKEYRDTGIKLGDKYHDNSRQIRKVAHIASRRGDERCPYGANYECETCRDNLSEQECKRYQHQCKDINDPEGKFFPLEACRRTCETCTTKSREQLLKECLAQGKACGSTYKT